MVDSAHINYGELTGLPLGTTNELGRARQIGFLVFGHILQNIYGLKSLILDLTNVFDINPTASGYNVTFQTSRTEIGRCLCRLWQLNIISMDVYHGLHVTTYLDILLRVRGDARGAWKPSMTAL